MLSEIKLNYNALSQRTEVYMSTGYLNDIIDHIDNLNRGMNEAKTIEDIEKSWLHFDFLESHIKLTWPDDKRLNDTLCHLKSGLSQYTRDFRERLPSPYNGWRVQLTSLRSQVSPQFDNDGWPKR